MQRWVDVGLTDLVKGTYVDNYAETLDSNLADVMLAEFSYAGLFEPAKGAGTYWFDGGVIWNSDIISGIVECSKKVK